MKFNAARLPVLKTSRQHAQDFHLRFLRNGAFNAARGRYFDVELGRLRLQKIEEVFSDLHGNNACSYPDMSLRSKARCEDA